MGILSGRCNKNLGIKQRDNARITHKNKSLKIIVELWDARRTPRSAPDCILLLVTSLVLLLPCEDMKCDGIPGIMDANEEQQQRAPADERHCLTFI